MNHEDIQRWLLDRRTVIGASDAANLVGLGYSDALAVYNDKTSQETPGRGRNGLLMLGLEMEPIIQSRYEARTGMGLTPIGLTVYKHPVRPWQGCTPDFRRKDDGIFVQGKTVGYFDEDWGESGSDQIPDDYRLQVIQEMGVTETPIIEVAALARMTGEFRTYRLHFDPDTWDWLTEIESVFWKHVEAKSGLPDDWLAAYAETPPFGLKFEDGKERVLSVEDAKAVAEKIGLRERIETVKKEAEAEYDRLSDELKALFADEARVVAGDYTLTRTLIKGATVSYERKPSVRLNIKKPKTKGKK